MKLKHLHARETLFNRPDHGVSGWSHIKEEAAGLSPGQLDMLWQMTGDDLRFVRGLANELAGESDGIHPPNDTGDPITPVRQLPEADSAAGSTSACATITLSPLNVAAGEP